MSHQNPNFPSRPGTPVGREIGSTQNWSQSQPQQNMMPTMGTGQPSNMGMPGTGQRQMSPLDQLQSMMRSGQVKNNFSYEERKGSTNIDYSSVDSFINGGTDGEKSQSELMSLRREDAKNAVAPLIMHIANEYALRNSRFKTVELMITQFAMKFTEGHPVKTVHKYWEMMCNNSNMRQAIGFNVGTLFAHQMATGIMHEAVPDSRQSELLYQGCIDNILAIELCRWLTQSPSARATLQEEGPIGVHFRKRLLDQYRDRAPSISDSFAFMGIDSPYDGFEPKLEETLDHASDPANYVIKQYARPPEPYHQPVADAFQYQPSPESRTPVTDMLFELNRLEQENLAKQTTEQSQQRSPQSYYREETLPETNTSWTDDEDDAPLVFGEPTVIQDDFYGMTPDNHHKYNWKERLIAVPHTNLFTTDEEMLEVLRDAFFRGSYRYMRSIPGYVTVFTLDENGLPNGDDYLINIRGRSVETFLTNPELLLPHLKETEDGIVEVRNVDLVVDEEEQYDLDAVKMAAMEDREARHTLIEEIAVRDLEEQDREAMHVHTVGTRKGIMHATTNIEVHHESTLMSSPSAVTEVYRCLSMLVKDRPVNTSYFDFIRNVYHTIGRQFIEEGELIRIIDTYLKTELERHMIDRYGYSNDPKSNHYFQVHTLTDCFDDLEDEILKLCPEAHAELSTNKTSQTLISKSQCFVDRVEALRILTANIRPKSRTRAVEEYDAAMRVLFVREVIITRISNMAPPVNSAGESIAIVKRSEVPSLFKLISTAYGSASSKLKPGAEQIIVFTDASDQRWTFQTNRYDGGNVGTLRKLNRQDRLGLLDLMVTN
ncbi:hypothetical protein FDJ25_gp135 [Vibrio phage Aphrodite1]|uniref:Uncharacterized protein n=1 Tax=Vibrio phage Aphrodite1 TaxID=2070057 RepID=A0A2I7QHP8_9CAUD|nr:hypothetical protein FDJ25_gp135 [Vibrio phage Aphrodite1]AUR80920.1 hypothetical protein Aphrodite1_0066 [Vibrio phage Aphrodite1]